MKNNIIEGKSVLVTGSSRGIGLQIAKDFKEHQADVVFHASKDTSFFKGNVPNKKFILDFSEVDKVEEEYRKLFLKNNGIDILVLNAGVGEPENNLYEVDEGYLRKVTNINIISQIILVKTHLSLVQKFKKKNSTIIYISSVAGEIPRTKFPIYSSSKSAMNQFLKIMSQEFKSHKTRINIVSPGSIKTEMTERAIEKYSHIMNISKDMSEEKLYSKINSISRMGTTNEVSNLVLFLASDAASYINGENIKVNGGYLYE